MARRLTLFEHSGEYAVCRLAPGDSIPVWALSGPFTSITRTPEELSVVCPAESVPRGVRCERGWKRVSIAGPIPFSETGVLSSLVDALAVSGVAVFAVSTFDTDHLLVKQSQWPVAVEAWSAAGHSLTLIISDTA